MQATVSEYSDFLSLSTLLIETAIDPIAQNAAEQLGYRAGLTVDTIVRTEFDSTTAVELDTIGSTLTVHDLRRAKTIMEAADVQPMSGDDFRAVFHPYAVYDLMADNTAGGFIDIAKYAANERLLNGEVGRCYGIRIVQSTNVKTSGTAPNLKYHGYVVGEGAVGAVSLAGSGPTKVEDPDRQSFRIMTINGGPSQADPEGKIGAYVSYRFVFAVKILDTVTYRYRVIKADASLV